jgi:predicted lipoprotein with Yx(FWY)xxD motif
MGGTQACTMEAMVCPDGSSVGRTGPNCAFAPCPEPDASAGSNEPSAQSDAGGPTGTAADDQGIGDGSVAGGGDGSGVSQNLILGISATEALGTYLSAYNGMTLYAYAPDKQSPGASACTGSCAESWPPYTVRSKSDIHVSPATAGEVGTITRADGALQVTYNGAPLYFYAKDSSPSDARGQGAGGAWSVVKP